MRSEGCLLQATRWPANGLNIKRRFDYGVKMNDMHWLTSTTFCPIHACWRNNSYTSKLKILRIKKREYRDGIETRPGWGEAHNVYKACVGTTEGF